MEEVERQPRDRGGGDRGEGFITQDLLLLPGGGEALKRATALHTWGAFIRCADLDSVPLSFAPSVSPSASLSIRLYVSRIHERM